MPRRGWQGSAAHLRVCKNAGVECDPPQTQRRRCPGALGLSYRPTREHPAVSEPPAGLRAVIASDNFLTREGLACLLGGVRSIEIVARVDSHPKTLDAVR